MIADKVLIVLLPGEFAARAAFLDSTNSFCSLEYGDVALNFWSKLSAFYTVLISEGLLMPGE